MRIMVFVLALLAAPAAARSITLDDVLAFERLDRASVSPDGALVAAVVLRPAMPGEVYGRTAYEVDPSRGDVWIIDRATGQRRNITNGRPMAAGHWCATWSPDGQRLALLSTRPEGREARGGDNVRLYVWERATGRLHRRGDWAIATQTRYGGGTHVVDIAGPGQAKPDPCTDVGENPPFAWLDARRLLVAALPAGQTSAVLDNADRTYAHTAATRATLREGVRPMVSASGSGIERTGMSSDERAILAIVDATTGARADIADVPFYPFNGSLGVRVAPDGRSAVVLASVSRIAPQNGTRLTNLDDEWTVEKCLGVLDLTYAQPIRWVNLPTAARWPTVLGAWMNDHRLELRARAEPQAPTAARFTLDIGSAVVGALPDVPEPTDPPRPVGLPAGAELIASDARGLVWRESTPNGVFLRAAAAIGQSPRNLLALNTSMAAINLGEVRFFDYPGSDAAMLKAAVIIPPGYRDGQRLPVITWVYGGYVTRGPDDYFLDPYMPGLYNLRVYAARGYAVLIPSMPLKWGGTQDHLSALAPAVMPAIDKLVELGIADPARVGVFGQSYGGFSALGLATQTNRFRAVVAMASLSDFVSMYGAFDPSARGYAGIEHEKSLNLTMLENSTPGFQVPLHADPDRYRRNSPLTFAADVTAPVLIIHGSEDVRGSLAQAEVFFNALYRQGKTARLLRYWGENHSLAASPATVRDASREIIAWFDRYLTAAPDKAGSAMDLKPSKR